VCEAFAASSHFVYRNTERFGARAEVSCAMLASEGAGTFRPADGNGELLQIVPNRASDRAKGANGSIGDITKSITYVFSVCQ
jgi:hypothetical protein